MNVVAIIQARVGSKRLPGKMTTDISGKTLLEQTLLRVQAIPSVENIVLATSSEVEDQPLIEIAKKLGIHAYAGSNEDVLDRYYGAAHSVNADVTIRLTGDCPLLDPFVCEETLECFFDNTADYVSNIRPPTYPDGLDVEIFTISALNSAWKESSLKSDREHVTQYIWRNPQQYKIVNYESNIDLSHLRWTVDEPNDLLFVKNVYDALSNKNINGHKHQDIINIIEDNTLEDFSGSFVRNEGQRESMTMDGLDYEKAMNQFHRVQKA